MKKYPKGTPGYLKAKFKYEAIRAVIYLALILAIYALGYMQTHTNKNILTIVAILGCLPFAKVMVSVIIRIPHKTVSTEIVEELSAKCSHLQILYDLVVTSEERAMPIPCLVLYGNKVFGYSSGAKVNADEAGMFIRKILRQNGFEANLKLYPTYKQFLSRAEGLDSIAAVEGPAKESDQESIASIIMNISL